MSWRWALFASLGIRIQAHPTQTLPKQGVSKMEKRINHERPKLEKRNRIRKGREICKSRGYHTFEEDGPGQYVPGFDASANIKCSVCGKRKTVNLWDQSCCKRRLNETHLLHKLSWCFPIASWGKRVFLWTIWGSLHRFYQCPNMGTMRPVGIRKLLICRGIERKTKRKQRPRKRVHSIRNSRELFNYSTWTQLSIIT